MSQRSVGQSVQIARSCGNQLLKFLLIMRQQVMTSQKTMVHHCACSPPRVRVVMIPAQVVNRPVVGSLSLDPGLLVKEISWRASLSRHHDLNATPSREHVDFLPRLADPLNGRFHSHSTTSARPLFFKMSGRPSTPPRATRSAGKLPPNPLTPEQVRRMVSFQSFSCGQR